MATLYQPESRGLDLEDTFHLPGGGDGCGKALFCFHSAFPRVRGFCQEAPPNLRGGGGGVSVKRPHSIYPGVGVGFLLRGPTLSTQWLGVGFLLRPHSTYEGVGFLLRGPTLSTQGLGWGFC